MLQEDRSPMAPEGDILKPEPEPETNVYPDLPRQLLTPPPPPIVLQSLIATSWSSLATPRSPRCSDVEKDKLLHGQQQLELLESEPVISE
ncbi:hypothetical protein SARC_03107 [Sphaeroforma arctica JP610]|uniref:Uncharacterized protein n=1 Tax=Sphaeroforma arctica JP610 TaxID=667725 RepID=A0A0L0G8W2_9EUKA|nr:hypothetical protein SARC_03107 [Sphaeroforma arctica JP610]KNC84673.1 hypothetical protein SARC_03107 [Sphaeroforma arctica JP610]|eukprot:XP_014158575.1 hypothetical protein SARC_03107 [Sphaeroforma arctica JP610]